MMSTPLVPHEAAIATIVESVGVLADRANFADLETLYADPVEVDYTSLAGGSVQTMHPRQLMHQWAQTLPGFDRTRHDVSHIDVLIDGQEAVATADVTASHWVDDRFWQAVGDYRYELRRTGNDWRITSHRFNLRSEVGSRDVFETAAARAATDPVSYLQRGQAEQAVRDLLESLEAKDMARFATLWAEDGVQHMPCAPDGFPKRVEGKEQILAHYANWPKNSGRADFTSNLTFYPMRDPKLVFAEFEGDVDVVTTGRHYEQRYGGLFRVERGKIKLFREYYDPAPFKYAFQLDEDADLHE